MIDGIAYFTNGLCIPSGDLDAVSYFTLGLCVPSAFGTPGAGLDGDTLLIARRRRQRFIEKAKQEAETVFAALVAVIVIEEDRDG